MQDTVIFWFLRWHYASRPRRTAGRRSPLWNLEYLPRKSSAVRVGSINGWFCVCLLAWERWDLASAESALRRRR